MGQVFRLVLTLMVWVIWVPASFASIRPSFSLDTCGWDATHIVVVTEGEKIDGKVVILESWRGNLRAGDRLDLPELAEFASLDSRKISNGFFDKAKPGDSQHVSGSRMVLFLKWQPEKEDPSKGTWTAASTWGGMRVSLAWIEGGQSYACVQWINPGQSDPFRLEMTEGQMNERVRHLDGVRAKLGRAAAIPDQKKRAEGLAPFFASDVFSVQEAALQLLSKCGEPALPTYRNLLGDGSLSEQHCQIVASMAKVGGPRIGEELTQMLHRDLGYWKTIGPTLPSGWWNGGGLEWTEVEVHRDRYGITLAAVRGIAEARCPEGRNAVRQLRDFWLSLPQLNEIGQMAEECNRVLGQLPSGSDEVSEDKVIEEDKVQCETSTGMRTWPLTVLSLSVVLCLACAFLLARRAFRPAE